MWDAIGVGRDIMVNDCFSNREVHDIGEKSEKRAARLERLEGRADDFVSVLVLRSEARGD